MTNYGITHLPGFLPAGRILTNNEAITEALDVLEYSGLKPVLRRVHTHTTSNHEHDVDLDHHPLPNPAAAEPSN